MAERTRLPVSQMCPYPGCKNVAWDKAPKGREEFCEGHAAKLCKMAEIGQCNSFVMPRSGWCKKHNAQVVQFDFIHKLRHFEAAQQAQMQAVVNEVAGNGKGMPPGLIRGR